MDYILEYLQNDEEEIVPNPSHCNNVHLCSNEDRSMHIINTHKYSFITPAM